MSLDLNWMRLKKDLYHNEQLDVKRTLVNILGLNQTSSIVLYELDHNTDLLQKIQSIVPSIRKYFSYKTGHYSDDMVIRCSLLMSIKRAVGVRIVGMRQKHSVGVKTLNTGKIR